MSWFFDFNVPVNRIGSPEPSGRNTYTTSKAKSHYIEKKKKKKTKRRRRKEKCSIRFEHKPVVLNATKSKKKKQKNKTKQKAPSFTQLHVTVRRVCHFSYRNPLNIYMPCKFK